MYTTKSNFMKNFSRQYWLNLSDFQKGLLMAVGGAVFGIIGPILQQWYTMPGWRLPYIDWALVVKTAISTASTYLAINFFTPVPKTISIDPSKTTVIDETTKEPVVTGATKNIKE